MFSSHLWTEQGRRSPSHPNYSSWNKQISSPPSSFDIPPLHFCSIKEGRFILQQSNYLSRLQWAETYLRFQQTIHESTSRQQLIQMKYTSSVRPWTTKQQQCIHYYIRGLSTYLYNWGLQHLFTQRSSPLQFILLSSGMDWNFPFTIGTSTIVFTEHVLHQMKRAVDTLDQSSMDRWLTTLCHEWTHLLQRTPSIQPIFYRWYKQYFGLRPSSVHIPRAWYDYIITNPDTIDSYLPNQSSIGPQWVRLSNTWVFTLSKGTIGKGELTGFGGYEYYMATMFVYKGKKQTVLICLQPYHLPSSSSISKKEQEYVMKGPILPADMLPEYRQLFFGCTKQIDHPHEAIANLFSEYIIQGNRYLGHPTLTTISQMSGRFYQELISSLSRVM